MRKLNNIKFKINDIPFNILNLYSLDKGLVLDTVAFINPENNLYFCNNYGFLDSFQNSENCTQEDIYDFFENVFVFNKLPVSKVKFDGITLKSKFRKQNKILKRQNILLILIKKYLMKKLRFFI